MWGAIMTSWECWLYRLFFTGIKTACLCLCLYLQPFKEKTKTQKNFVINSFWRYMMIHVFVNMSFLYQLKGLGEKRGLGGVVFNGKNVKYAI